MSPRLMARQGIRVDFTIYLVSDAGINAAIKLGGMSTVPRLDEAETCDGAIASAIKTVQEFDPGVTWRAMTDEEVKTYLAEEERERKADQRGGFVSDDEWDD